MTPDPVHIRRAQDGWKLCDLARSPLDGTASGGSISLRHYREQPAHVASLTLCPACVARADQIREGGQ